MQQHAPAPCMHFMCSGHVITLETHGTDCTSERPKSPKKPSKFCSSWPSRDKTERGKQMIWRPTLYCTQSPQTCYPNGHPYWLPSGETTSSTVSICGHPPTPQVMSAFIYYDDVCLMAFDSIISCVLCVLACI